jgi:hypothetical protein
MSLWTEEELEAKVETTKALIEAYETAMLTLASGAQSYTLDTGQTRQVVTKVDVGSMRLALDTLYNRLDWLEGQLCGTGAARVLPGW